MSSYGNFFADDPKSIELTVSGYALRLSSMAVCDLINFGVIINNESWSVMTSVGTPDVIYFCYGQSKRIIIQILADGVLGFWGFGVLGS